jgi:hypothetical protein
VSVKRSKLIEQAVMVNFESNDVWFQCFFEFKMSFY